MSKSLCHTQHLSQPHPARMNEVFAIVSRGNNRGSDPARNSTWMNHRCYAARHGLQFHFLEHDFAHPLGGYWNKIFVLYWGLQRIPHGTWAIWMDSDAFITNLKLPPNVMLETHLRSSTGVRRDTSSCNILVKETARDGIINNGVVGYRRTCWTAQFLDRWWAERLHCAIRPLYDNAPFMLATWAAATQTHDLPSARHTHLSLKRLILHARHPRRLAALNGNHTTQFAPMLKRETTAGSCFCEATVTSTAVDCAKVLFRPFWTEKDGWYDQLPLKRSHAPMHNHTGHVCPSTLPYDGIPWVSGQWFAHFPGSKMKAHRQAYECFDDFRHAFDPTAPHREPSTVYRFPAACSYLKDLSSSDVAKPTCASGIKG